MAAAAKLKGQEEQTAREVAIDALAANGGDVLRATEWMIERVGKSRALYRSLMDPLVKTACYETIASVCRKNRSTIWNTQQPTAEEQRGRVIALAGGTMSSLLDFPLPGGLPLRLAGRGDVAAAAEFYSRQSKDMNAKARWLQMIAQSIPDDKTVQEVMTDARLAELQEEARRD